MKPFPIPENDQLNAMIDYKVYDLVLDYEETPSLYNLKKYLTVTRPRLLEFLVLNPIKTRVYFERHEKNDVFHDGEKLWKEDGRYFVTSMDHGKKRNVKKFISMEEAVAEHLLSAYGMY